MLFTALPQSTHALVRLRPIGVEDLPALYAYLTMPVVYELTSAHLTSPGELVRYVWKPGSDTPTSALNLAVVDARSHEVVGTAGFHTVSAQNRSAEITYDLAPKVWGQGIATYICGLLTSWAHVQAGVVRVQATVLEANLRSARVLERCGFQREGLLRSYRMVRGEPGDYFMFSHVADVPCIS